jgi:osmotically-inducible protein OsmY
MRLDSDVRRDVEDELRSDPDIDATDIAVAVKGGSVTLIGFVRSFSATAQGRAGCKARARRRRYCQQH